MKKLPLVSVLIVTHNRKELLRKCLESVRNQTYKNIETIVVDDGSTDDFTDLLGLATIFVQIPKSGIAIARNVAMEEASGEYYFILDSDDTIEPTCIEKSIEYIIENKADWLISELNIIDEENNIIGFFPSKIQTFEECFQSKYIPHPSTLLCARFVGDTRYDTEFISAVDLDFTLALLLKNPKIVLLPERLTNYRKHGNQETGTEKQNKNAMKIREKYIPWINK